jgi:hypothetical protein
MHEYDVESLGKHNGTSPTCMGFKMNNLLENFISLASPPGAADPQTCRVKILNDLRSIAGKVELMIPAGAQQDSATVSVIGSTSVHENRQLT